jgi:hypothetical protein
VQVPGLYVLADQYQVKSATKGLKSMMAKAKIGLPTVLELIPAAAAYGDATKQLRIVLVQHAAKYVEQFEKEPAYLAHVLGFRNGVCWRIISWCSNT